MATIGSHVRALRLKHGLKQAALAAMQEHELVFLWRDLPEAGRQMVLDAAHSAARALKTEKT